MKVERRTVDLAAYPDLVVIYLGMKVNAITGLKTLFGFGPRISNSVAAAPEGLLRHENVIYSLLPPHVGMRQYWRDFESLERWARWSRTCNGGNHFCAIQAARDSGMKLILCAEESKRSMTISGFRWGCHRLLQRKSREERCFRRELDWAFRELRRHPRQSPRPVFTAKGNDESASTTPESFCLERCYSSESA